MTTPKPSNALTPIVVGLVVVFCFTIAACVAIFIAAPDGANTGSLVTILLSALGNIVGTLALFVKFAGTDAKVDKVAADTHALTNGLLDSKVRAGVADVVAPHLLHPGAGDLLVEDRLARQTAHDIEPDTRP